MKTKFIMCSCIPTIIFMLYGLNLNGILLKNSIDELKCMKEISINEYIENIIVEDKEELTKAIPILMYHSVVERAEKNTEISLKIFEEHIKTLKAEGYTGLFLEDLVDYVESNKCLPQKSVIITFDDGYLNNYELAYPILKKYDMKATIFVIGSSIGSMKNYKETEYPIIPHFTIEQAREMVNSGIISIQSHTYDMHQWRLYESGDCIRENILKLNAETKEEYKNVLTQDNSKMKDIINGLGSDLIAVAYPEGRFDDLTNEILKDNFIKVTLSTVPGISEIKRGDSESLYSLKRFNMYDGINKEEILKLITK